MDIASLIAKLAEHGISGLVCAILAVWVWQKDKELRKEREARIGDVRELNKTAMELQARVIETVNKVVQAVEQLTEVSADLKRAMLDLERRDRGTDPRITGRR